MKPTYILVLYLIVFNILSAYAQGLEFNSSYDKEIGNRTSYTVFANRTPTMKEELNIAFDLSIMNPNQFGYLCAIDMINENHLFSLSIVDYNGSVFLKLNLEGESNLLTVPLKLKNWGKGKWNHLNLYFNFSNNDIYLTINDSTYKCSDNILKESIKTNIYFGKHNNIIDVPNFAIRDLIVKDSKHKYHFCFEEDSGNAIHNNKGEAIGYVNNPIWLINDSYFWKHLYTQTCNSISAIQYDNINDQFLIAEKDSLTIVDLINNRILKKTYLNKHPLTMILGMSCMNSTNLMSYELRNMGPEQPTIATLDLNELKWNINSSKGFNNERHHHNAYFNEEKQQLYIFGGFGDKRFYSELNRYDVSTDTWDVLNLSGDKIFPRFYSGMGILNKHLVIFGGVGNPTGEQAVGKKYYYDCHLIDLENQSVKKLWEIDKGETRLVSSRSLIFSSDSSSFYTICYPEYIPETFLKLYKFDLSDGKYEILGDSIPMISEEIKTNANLYISSDSNLLYCATQQFINNDSCVINIYSISNPPRSNNNLTILEHSAKNNKIILVWTIIIAFICLLSLLYYYLRKRQPKVASEKNSWSRDWTVQSTRPTKNAIYLFGDFAFFNHQGKEISYQFSPQMKQLFLLITIKSANIGIGVDSKQIYNSIWPDKQLESAKNLKGVTINKIRNLLNEIEGVELIYENKYFVLKTKEPSYIDYFEFSQLHNLKQIDINIENTEKLSRIISRGQFLQNMELEFLDLFKAEVTNQIFNIAPHILKQLFTHKNFTSCIFLAKILYFSDELNASAFYFIIQSNIELKRAIEAKKQYNKYVSKYQEILGEDYTLLYTEVLKESKKHIKNLVVSENKKRPY